MEKLTQLDRTIFHLLRKEVVARGYLADAEALPNITDYNSANEAIESTGRELIHVFGVGSPESKLELNSHRIIIHRRPISRGNIGGGTSFISKNEEGANFTKKKRPSTTKNVSYEIRHITNSAEYDRLLYSIIFNALKDRTYVNLVSTAWNGSISEDTELLIWEGDTEILSSKVFKERVYNYTFLDVWLEEDEELQTDIVPLTTINIHVEVGINTEKQRVTTTVTDN